MAKKEPESYGGHNHEFVGEVADRYNCQICTKVIREPHLAVCCGQHFCESCLNKWFTRQGKESCPHCRAEGEGFNHVINKGLRSEINQLKIKCSNYKKGCKWMGELGALKAHLESDKGCGFVVVDCPNKCQPPYTILRKELAVHLKSECLLRPYQCEYCGLKDTYQHITGVVYLSRSKMVNTSSTHYSECPAYPLTCPNKCGAGGIKRKDMADHRSKCPQEHVECPFAEAGCYDKPRRHQFDEHLTSNQQSHLLLMMEAYKEMKNNLQSTEAKLKENKATLKESEAKQKAMEAKFKENEAKLMKAEEKLKAMEAKLTAPIQQPSQFISGYLKEYGDSIVITMPDVTKHIRTGQVWCSPPFYYKEGYKVCLRVNIIDIIFNKSANLTVNIQLLQGEHDDKLRWPIGHEGHCELILLPPYRHRATTTQLVVFRMCGMEQLQTKRDRYNETLGSSVLVNDCLTFYVSYGRCDLEVKVK